jgi:ribonucleotide reductase alpha subunit
VTTIKPSGTISLLNGSSPGVHAPYAPYYIRRTRLAANDPMVPSLQEAGVPWEHDQYDQTGHTLVFSFPTKAVHTRFTVQTETIRDQIERQVAVQENWADSAVSATLSFDPESEKSQMAELLRTYVPRLKSVSMLAKSGHGYVQSPYQAVDEGTYHHLSELIRQDHQLVTGGEMAGLDDCSHGACPIR